MNGATEPAGSSQAEPHQDGTPGAISLNLLNIIIGNAGVRDVIAHKKVIGMSDHSFQSKAPIGKQKDERPWE
jgi:hypothetical protein